MGVSVPNYQPQVQPGLAEVAHPTFAAPNPEAFGTGVASAMEQAGAKVQASTEQLTSHLIERQNQMQEVKDSNDELTLRGGMEKLMYSTDAITITDKDGKQQTVPEGALNWKQEGSYDYFMDKYSQMAAQFIKDGTTPQSIARRAAAAANLTRFTSETVGRNAMNVHKGIILNTVDNSIQSDNKQASGLIDNSPQSQKSLSFFIAHAGQQMDLAHDIQNMKGSPLAKDRKDQAMSGVLQQSIAGAIQSSPNSDTANQILNAHQGEISPESYLKLQDYIKTQQKSTQSELKLQQEQGEVDNRIEAFKQLTQLDPKQAPSIIKKFSLNDNALGVGMQKVVDRDANYTPDNEDEQDQMKMWNGMIKAGNSKDVTDSVLDYLQKNGGKLKPSELATVMQTAVNLHNALPTTKHSDSPIDSIKTAIAGGIRAIVKLSSNLPPIAAMAMLGKYNSGISNGSNAYAATDAAVKDYATKQNPSVALMDKAPNVITGNGGSQRYFIGKETDDSQYPYVYDEASKMTIPNKNFKQKRPEKK